MSTTTGLKLIREDCKSLNGNHLRLDYSPSRAWRKAPGNGVYLAVTGGLDAGGMGPLMAVVLARKPTGASAPDGVICYAEYRVTRVVDAAPLYADYRAKRATLYADYDAKCAPLYADYRAKRATLDADYDAKCAPLYADYEAKCDTLYADLYAAKRDTLYADYAAKRAPLDADYDAKCAPLYADYEAKCDTLFRALITKARKAKAGASEMGKISAKVRAT